MEASALQEKIAQASQWTSEVRTEMHRVLVGQEALMDRLLLALLSNGHVLLEGVPGLAKTLSVRALAGCLDVEFQRLQFTPDLLPADLLGTMIYNPQQAEFTTKRGPIFSNLILADEINRAPAKVQSALLEAMQERQVTLGETSYALPDPFLVMATQNPIDQEGTYPLPEAQLDRFLVKVVVDYPKREEEREILDLMATSAKPPETTACLDPAKLRESRALVNQIYLDGSLRDYIVELIQTTRDPSRFAPELAPLIRCGASPRGTLALALSARAQAFLAGREFVIPEDIKDLAVDVLRHRVLLTYEAQAEEKDSQEIVQTLLSKVPVP
ncbi:MAG: MoxR family ATPase [Verrucomicrobiota bacterium]